MTLAGAEDEAGALLQARAHLLQQPALALPPSKRSARGSDTGPGSAAVAEYVAAMWR